jgi:hypothetical protein
MNEGSKISRGSEAQASAVVDVSHHGTRTQDSEARVQVETNASWVLNSNLDLVISVDQSV